MAEQHNARLAKTLFRSILRWARHNADVPFTLRASDVHAVVPTLQASPASQPGAAAVAAIARYAFREARGPQVRRSALQPREAGMRAMGDALKLLATMNPAQPVDVDAALDRGLEALRTLNTTYAALLDAMRSSRAERTDRTGIELRVGQVFVHRKYNYRGVVYGWDRRCERDAEWCRRMSADPEQPYYYCLPDEMDCQRLFGGVRLTKYVGQDNILPVEGVRVVHRALDSYFKGFSEASGRYVPLSRLAYEYPDDYEAPGEALCPAAQDANLLLHPEAGAAGTVDEASAGAAGGGPPNCGGGGGGRGVSSDLSWCPTP